MTMAVGSLLSKQLLQSSFNLTLWQRPKRHAEITSPIYSTSCYSWLSCYANPNPNRAGVKPEHFSISDSLLQACHLFSSGQSCVSWADTLLAMH